MKYLSHSKLSAESRRVAEFLKLHGPHSLAELLVHFPDEGRTPLRKRLSNMGECNWLDINWDAKGTMLWHFAGRSRVPRALAQAPAAPVAQPQQLVPPRQINVMAGVYMPPAGPAMRPGALDFQRCPTRGVRC